jgi:serine/threonine-protein kinase
LLLPDRAGKEALVRFEREVQRTAMLTHPNTVTVFDDGRTTDGL